MIVQWKGRGWTVFFVPIALLFVVFGALIFSDLSQALPKDSDAAFRSVVAVWLLLSGAVVYAIDHYLEGKARRRRGEKGGLFPEVVRDDEFLYVRMWAWPYVLWCLALVVLAGALLR